jgi:hypothetical protein
MPVYLVWENELAKDKERRNEYRKVILEEYMPYVEKMQKKGVFKITGLGDNTGYVLGIMEFEDLDAFGKVWNDDKFHFMVGKIAQLVNKSKIRLCRPSRLRPRDQW